MNEDIELLEQYSEVCCGNRDAERFIAQWNLFVHGIDDIIDTGNASAEEIISVFAQANVVYSQQFYRDHYLTLQPVILLITNAYADSVLWEKRGTEGQKKMADVLRFAGNEILFAVALICGGYQHMRSVSAGIRDKSWKTHHNNQGESV
jgi:hypothetical protein